MSCYTVAAESFGGVAGHKQVVRHGGVQAVLQGREPTAADVENLPVCEAVILETLRLHPPAYMIGRCAAHDTTLPGPDHPGGVYSVPAGTTALVAPYLLHRDGRRWERADQFDPQRWLGGEAASGGQWRAALAGLGPNGAYLPFGGGPRNCIGTGFAMMEGLLLMAMILQRWRLVPPGKEVAFPTPAPLITLRPERVELRLRTRVPKGGSAL